jgi:methylglutaconyl-CoA hydratase
MLASSSYYSSSADVDRQILVQQLRSENLPGAPSVTLVTLNRPKANAMGRRMLQELQDCLKELEDQTDSRCVVLQSFSPKVFSAGADLKERKTMTISQAHSFVHELRQTFQRWSALPMPTVAAMRGVALGGGLELALASDLRVAARSAVFGLPETTLAIVPGAGGTQRLARLVGPARAKELIWNCTSRWDATTALQYGLVQHVIDEDDAQEPLVPQDQQYYSRTTEFALDMAWKIAAAGPVAIRASKFAIDEGLACPRLEDALKIEEQAYDRVLETRDRLEGLAAFAEQRAPEYRGY